MKKMMSFLMLILVCMMMQSNVAYATETKETITISDDYEEKKVFLLSSIFNNAERLEGEVYVTDDSILKKIQSFARDYESEDCYEKFGIRSFNAKDKIWELNSLYGLYLNSSEREFYLIDEKSHLSSIISFGSGQNADYVEEMFMEYIMEFTPIFSKYTLTTGKDFFSIWELGRETRYVLQNFDNPKFEMTFRLNENDYVLLSADNHCLKAINIDTRDIIDIAEDYSGVDVDTFLATVYYINTNGNAVVVSLIDDISFVNTHEVITELDGSDSIRGYTFSGEMVEMLGYYDQTGEFILWKEEEIKK